MATAVWLTCLAATVSLGAGAAFGTRHLWRLGRHVKATRQSTSNFWWVFNILFGMVLVAILMRITLVALIPAMGIPLSALWEGYGLLLGGHLLGVVIRTRRLEWASHYA